MGGDHKCPVCQATFTRPQHVARHMRSHTGDRPYKCQHCGDQFARSDLLSRHVNKCHANEKQNAPATGGRRKGSMSATRATTSKQACDQCVQASLPCDGCNPCAKCVQRKCRCTFVKFHRQTAPVGPGHNPRPAMPPSQQPPTAIPPVYHNPDDFLLSYQQTQPPTQAQFNPNSIWSNWRGSPPKYPNQSPATGYSYPAYVRKQASLDNLNGIPPMAFPSTSGSVRPTSYHGHQQSSHSPDYGQQASAADSYSDYSSDYASSADGHSYDSHSYPSSHDSHSYSSSHEGHSTTTFAYDPQAQGEGGFSSAFGLMSLDDPAVLAGLSSDGVPFFSQAPTASTSSGDRRPATSGGYHPPSHQHQHQQQQQQQQQPPPSYAGLGGQTPSAGREAETRELKEFWKQYMRTPLTGPGGANATTPGWGPAYDGQSGRRHRVNSLPSVKTPTALPDAYPLSQQQAKVNTSTAQRAAGNMGAVDDLRSYEAAVLARKAPSLSLDAVVSARARKGQQVSSSSNQNLLPLPGSSAQLPISLNAPPPASQTLPSISSLAASAPHSVTPPNAYAIPEVHFDQSTDSSSSRESSLGVTSRPSFKRLASQTLGPDESKFAKTEGVVLS